MLVRSHLLDLRQMRARVGERVFAHQHLAVRELVGQLQTCLLYTSTFGIDPKVAMLSFSTKGSGKGGTVALSHDAVIKAQEMDPELAVDGELQFDAAVAPEVAQVKCKGSKVAGQANTFIFPDVYKRQELHRVSTLAGGRGLYRQWGISPRPETNFLAQSTISVKWHLVEIIESVLHILTIFGCCFPEQQAVYLAYILSLIHISINFSQECLIMNFLIVEDDNIQLTGLKHIIEEEYADAVVNLSLIHI